MNMNMSFDGIRKIPVVRMRWGHRSSHLIRYSLICIYTPFTHTLRIFAPCFLCYNLELCSVESVCQHAEWKGQLHTYRGRWQPALSERHACCLQGSKGNGVLQLEQGKHVGSSRALSGYDLDGHKSVLRPNPHQKALRCSNLVSSRAGRHRG
ncbi:hypothetical protein CPB84DRAFT_1795502 [Gymnopilus junonius]|uniref:Uncharacterized protein n=1 Tax=Gymnopilus junonius TaxID=109634 RepID=A0A9P5NCR5_GYMJU|nr:hypothetical protein CPB84DRAFT_1795502 [Gymnopilus junonius]